jgi:hypothetical protein
MADEILTFTGLEQVLANLVALGKSVPGEAGGALYELAEETMDASQPLVPVDFGVLKNSKFVEQPKQNGGDISVTLGYGGEAAKYAEAVHEHPSSHDPKSWNGVTVNWQTPGTGPKFLERPVVALQRDFAARVAATVKARLGL